MKLQFRLRTLMIVVTLLAVPLGYVGWQAKIVRERESVLAALQEKGASVVRADETVILHNVQNWEIHVDDGGLSALGQLLGDQFVRSAVAPASVAADELNQFRAAFPEASVTKWTPYPK